ncbi:MAG: LysR family transcriptional regulator [Boseongicola sp.]|nr:LysR family transcriptional regulator [Boseongicola sp.]
MLQGPVFQLEFKHFRQLAILAEEGSIRAASRRLRISQPALSRSIRSIEDKLQAKVVERGPQGVTLTRYGEILRSYGRIIDANVRFAAEEIEDHRGSRSGSIRMGIGPYEGFTIVHRAIDRMRKRRPDLEVTILEGDFGSLSEKLLAGQIDLILGPTPVDKNTPGLTGQILAHTRPVLVVRSSHPLTADKVDMHILAASNWILSVEGTNARKWIGEVFARHGLPPPKGPISAYPSMTALAMVKEMDLIALLPRQLVERDISEGLLRTLPTGDEEFVLPVRLTTREFGVLSPVNRQMIAELKQVCKEIGDQL